METSYLDVDHRLQRHQVVWSEKETLRLIYGDYYRRMLGACPPGVQILDIGGGSAHAKDFNADIITLDILPFPGIDVVADAHELPFAGQSFGGILMLDVLHHLARPVVFLKEAARVLKPGGILTMIEPGISPVSWWFYNFLHQEPVRMGEDPFAMLDPQPGKDPFDSNQAIPTLMFGRRRGLSRLSANVQEFQVLRTEWLSLMAYPLSGGFKRWCLMPASLVPAVLRLEDRLPSEMRRLMGFRLFTILRRC